MSLEAFAEVGRQTRVEAGRVIPPIVVPAEKMNIEVGLPAVARSVQGERRVVDQRFSRSNPLLTWLRQIDGIRLGTYW